MLSARVSEPSPSPLAPAFFSGAIARDRIGERLKPEPEIAKVGARARDSVRSEPEPKLAKGRSRN